MELLITICVICLCVLILFILILLGILLYNQMLLTNEVNKRLLILAETSVTQERITQDELDSKVSELDELTNFNKSKEEKELYRDEDLEL